MKAFFSKILDFLYALKDWILILLIALAVIVAIAWRLDSMFTQKLSTEEIPVLSGVVKEGPSDDEEGTTAIDPSQEVTPPEEGTDETSDAASTPEAQEPTLISLTIDEAKDVPAIGQALQASGMIEDANAFGARLTERERTDALIPGHYEIPANYTLDQIIDLITTE